MDRPHIVYLDHAAGTPVAPEVIDAMHPYLRDCYGNPSGAHAMARHARRAVDDARDVLAEALDVDPGGVVFTSGGTEADNLAVRGVHERCGGTVVCSAIEHHAVLDPVQRLGGRVVPTGNDGIVDLEALAAALDEAVSLVSVMTVNNEVGTVQPIDAVGRLVATRAPGAVVHTDAVQALAWLDVGSACAAADLISVSGHKIGAPKGVGALAIRGAAAVAPQLLGGGQERDRRGGTQNVPGIVGLATAVRLVVERRHEQAERIGALRGRLLDGLLDAVPDSVETGRRTNTAPGIAHLCFPGVESEALIFLLERHGLCASAAASCASGAGDPSHVLAAMGYDPVVAAGSLRLSLGYETTGDDIDHALAVVPAAVAQLRGG